MSADDKKLQITEPNLDLQAAVDQEKINRDIIKKYVSDQLVKGTDYGTIVGSKPTLLKPGMEKIFSLLKLTSMLEKDAETWEMLGSQPGLVCYKATLYRDGSVQPYAEGRGSAAVGEKKRDANSTVKIAEKRARMDACLSLGFSEFFTQDLEDMDLHSGQPDFPVAHVKKADGVDGYVGPTVHHDAVYGSGKPATPKQIDFVRQLLIQKAGVKTVAESHLIMERYGVEGKSPDLLTMTEAKRLIDALLNYKLPTDDDLPPIDSYMSGGDDSGN